MDTLLQPLSKNSMITYEITAQVRDDLIETYEAYMRDRHIHDVLATGHFASASFARSAKGRYRIRYEAFDEHALDAYLNNDAPALRQHFTDQFPQGIELSRENWTVLEDWPAEKGSG